MPSLWLFVCLGVLFGAVASPMAYIIFYQEYIHHLTEQQARATALRAAVTAYAFIVAVATASGGPCPGSESSGKEFLSGRHGGVAASQTGRE